MHFFLLLTLALTPIFSSNSGERIDVLVSAAPIASGADSVDVSDVPPAKHTPGIEAAETMINISLFVTEEPGKTELWAEVPLGKVSYFNAVEITGPKVTINIKPTAWDGCRGNTISVSLPDTDSAAELASAIRECNFKGSLSKGLNTIILPDTIS